MIKLIPVNRYEDDRGFLVSLHKTNDTLFPPLVESRLSFSKKGVLRGLHGDSKTGKLFYPVNGVIQFFAQDIKSKDRVFFETFSNDYNTAIYVPPGYINGHLCLTNDCILYYAWTEYYNGPENQWTVKYDDKDLNINWDYTIISNISDRDKNGISYKELQDKYDD